MKREEYAQIESYMRTCMKDSAHDMDHVYRVLYVALDIAAHEEGVDSDVLIAACLLHDVGRPEQSADPAKDHAEVGARKAWAFLTGSGFSRGMARRVSECIYTHRFRTNCPPESIEAKILYDSDKIDVAGAIGIARTLQYSGSFSEPLYSLHPDGTVSDGTDDTAGSFFHEYKFKLEKIYGSFYTARANEIAASRRDAAVSFYSALLSEVTSTFSLGLSRLSTLLE